MEALSAPTNKDGHLEGITATIQKNKMKLSVWTRKTGSSWMDVPEVGKRRSYYNALRIWCIQAEDKRMSDMLLLSRNQLFAKYVSHVDPKFNGKRIIPTNACATYVELYRKMYLHKTTTLSQVPTRKVYLTDEWVDCTRSSQSQGANGERLTVSSNQD